MDQPAKQLPPISEAIFPFMHAVTHAVESAGENFKKTLEARRQRRNDRIALRQLMSFSDTQLRDIGLSHDDVRWASRQSSGQSATGKLQEIARSQHMHSAQNNFAK